MSILITDLFLVFFLLMFFIDQFFSLHYPDHSGLALGARGLSAAHGVENSQTVNRCCARPSFPVFGKILKYL